MKTSHQERDAPPIYQIRVEGALDSDWDDWFGGLEVSACDVQGGGSMTTLTGPVRDQAALRGLLDRLWDLNLTLVSVTRLETERGQRPMHED